MTTIIVVLIGIGVVFIASSLDCTPIRETFNAIVTNQAIDWSGTKNCQANIPSAISETPSGAQYPTRSPINVPATAQPVSPGKCPTGYHWDNNVKQCLRDYRGVL